MGATTSIMLLQFLSSANMSGINKAISGIVNLESSIYKAENAAFSIAGAISGPLKDASIGLGVAAVGGALALNSMFRQSARLEDKLYSLTTVSDQARTAGIGPLRDEFRRLTTGLPISATEFAAATIEIAKLGVEGLEAQKGIGLLAAQMATVTDMSSDLAAKGVVQILSSFDLMKGSSEETAKKAREVADATVYLANRSAANASELIDFTVRVGNLGAELGYSYQQIQALGTAMKDAGIRTETSGTAMANIISSISKRLPAFAARIGVTTEQFAVMFENNHLEATLKAAETFKGENIRTIGAALGVLGVRGQGANRTMLALGRNADTVRERFKELNEEGFAEGGTLARVFNVQSQSMVNVLRTLRGAIANVAGSFGDPLLVIMKPIVVLMTEFMGILLAIPTPIKVVITLVGVLATGLAGLVAIGGLLTTVMLAMSVAIGRLGFGLAASLPGITKHLAAWSLGFTPGNSGVINFLKGIAGKGKTASVVLTVLANDIKHMFAGGQAISRFSTGDIGAAISKARRVAKLQEIGRNLGGTSTDFRDYLPKVLPGNVISPGDIEEATIKAKKIAKLQALQARLGGTSTDFRDYLPKALPGNTGYENTKQAVLSTYGEGTDSIAGLKGKASTELSNIFNMEKFKGAMKRGGEKVTGWTETLKTGIAKGLSKVSGATDFYPKAMPNLSQMAMTFLSSPISTITMVWAQGTTAAIAFFEVISSGFMAAGAAAWPLLLPIIKLVALLGVLYVAWLAIKEPLMETLTAFGSIFEPIIDGIRLVFKQFAAGGSILDGLVGFMKILLLPVIAGLKILTYMFKGIAGVVGYVAGIVFPIIAEIFGIVTAIFQVIDKMATISSLFFRVLVGGLLEATGLGALFERIIGGTFKFFTMLASGVVGVFSKIKNFIMSIMPWLMRTISGLERILGIKRATEAEAAKKAGGGKLTEEAFLGTGKTPAWGIQLYDRTSAALQGTMDTKQRMAGIQKGTPEYDRVKAMSDISDEIEKKTAALADVTGKIPSIWQRAGQLFSRGASFGADNKPLLQRFAEFFIGQANVKRKRLEQEGVKSRLDKELEDLKSRLLELRNADKKGLDEAREKALYNNTKAIEENNKILAEQTKASGATLPKGAAERLSEILSAPELQGVREKASKELQQRQFMGEIMPGKRRAPLPGVKGDPGDMLVNEGIPGTNIGGTLFSNFLIPFTLGLHKFFEKTPEEVTREAIKKWMKDTGKTPIGWDPKDVNFDRYIAGIKDYPSAYPSGSLGTNSQEPILELVERLEKERQASLKALDDRQKDKTLQAPLPQPEFEKELKRLNENFDKLNKGLERDVTSLGNPNPGAKEAKAKAIEPPKSPEVTKFSFLNNRPPDQVPAIIPKYPDVVSSFFNAVKTLLSDSVGGRSPEKQIASLMATGSGITATEPTLRLERSLAASNLIGSSEAEPGKDYKEAEAQLLAMVDFNESARSRLISETRDLVNRRDTYSDLPQRDIPQKDSHLKMDSETIAKGIASYISTESRAASMGSGEGVEITSNINLILDDQVLAKAIVKINDDQTRRSYGDRRLNFSGVI